MPAHLHWGTVGDSGFHNSFYFIQGAGEAAESTGGAWRGTYSARQGLVETTPVRLEADPSHPLRLQLPIASCAGEAP